MITNNYSDEFDAMTTEHHLEHHRNEERMKKMCEQLKEKMTADEPSSNPYDAMVINIIHQMAIEFLAPLTKHVESSQMAEFNMLHLFAFSVFVHLQRKGIIKVVYDQNRKPSCSCGETPCTCPF